MPAFTPNRNLYLPGGGSLGIGGDDEVADIDKINQNFQNLDEWTGDIDAKLEEYEGQAFYAGTDAERLAIVPPKLRDGIRFKCTDTNAEWDRYKGAWRKISGSHTFPAAAWSTTKSSGTFSYAGRTVTLTVPYPVDENETLQVTQYGGGTGFTSTAMANIVRNDNDTQANLRLTQLDSLATQQFVVAWRIVPIG